MRLTLAFLLALPVLFAQDDDPPSRIARLNYIEGSVSLRPAGLEDWVAAEINRPLTTGDNLWTDESTRAELHVGATAIRLGSRTAFELLNLDDRVVQIRLAEGSLSIRLRNLEQDQTFEIDTPNLSFTLLRAGEYRIDVNPDTNETVAIVRSGDGEASGGGQSVTVHARQQARAGGLETVNYDITAAPNRDSWDQWCAQRDQREDHSESARYVSEGTVGVEDLDLYGTWSEEPTYSAVWYPSSVPDGWSPYRYGHWVWIEPWGWTWVDNAPWGFAPFHYGRWIFVAGRWGWVPGPKAVRPVYSPALVAWVGGPRLNASVTFGGGRGGVAWFPLGPGDIYVPAHRASRLYLSSVNRNIRVDGTNGGYRNRTAPGAITAVSEDVFVRSRPVAASSVRLTRVQAESGDVIAHAPYSPQRESVAGTTSAGLRPSTTAINRQVVARRTPPPSAVPFITRQQALQADPGRPLTPDSVRRLQTPGSDTNPRIRTATSPSRQSDRREAVRIADEQPVLVQPTPRPVEIAPRRMEEAPHGAVEVIQPSRPVEITPRVRPAEQTPRVQQVDPAPRRPVEVAPPSRPVEITPRARPVEQTPRVQQVDPAPRRPVEVAPPSRPVEITPRVRPVEPAPRIERVEPPPRHVETAPTGPPPSRIERPQEPPKREERRERPAPEKKEDKPKQ